jgi:hypothetical protein
MSNPRALQGRHSSGTDRASLATDPHFEIQLLRLLSTFLGEHPHPSASEWLRLVTEHPAHEAAIIDFAIRYAASGHISTTSLPARWLQVNA